MAFGNSGFESNMPDRVNPLIDVQHASDHSRDAWNGETRNLNVRAREVSPYLADVSLSYDKVSDQSVPSLEARNVAPYASANRFYPPAVDPTTNYYNRRFGSAESVVDQIGRMITSADNTQV